MAIPPQEVERLVRLLVWIGGVSTTIAGSWVASKIHVYHDDRKAHLEDLKQKALAPLRAGLVQHFEPLVFHRKPAVFVQPGATTEFHQEAKATESQLERGDVLVGVFPSALVFGPLDSALLQDARKVHFCELMSDADEFITAWLAYAGECQAWVRRMAQEILAKSGLPAFPNRIMGAHGFSPYVMHYRLAVFVYKRLFGFHAPALRADDAGTYWALNGKDATLACGPKEQVVNLPVELDNLRESESATARGLRDKAVALQKSFQDLVSDLNHATAARRLRKRCDLVTFF